MGDNNKSSDDEIHEETSPDLMSKKLKLNDGSSQDSIMEAGTSSKSENVDSGVSADKTGTSNTEEAAATSEGPSNEEVSLAPSGSNIRTILFNIRTPRLNRVYRKRKTPNRDSSSSSSSQDSDDLSGGEDPAPQNRQQSEGYDSHEELRRFIQAHTTMSDSDPSNEESSVASNDSFDTDELVHMSGDTESDDGLWSRGEEEENVEEEEDKTPAVLLKTRPKHNYVIVREIINREMGASFPAPLAFEQRFSGSLHAVCRLRRLRSLQRHRGCVNSINFHPEGHLLASGSDDTNVVVWHWARGAVAQTIRTGHKSNVFQSKFLHLNARSQLNIVTCARDGQVRLLQCPPSGGGASRRKLASHSRAAHKLHVSPLEPHVVLSAGEDGALMQSDVRADAPTRLLTVTAREAPVPLYSVHGHPLRPAEVALAGRDRFVRVYDRRRATAPQALYCPAVFRSNVSASRKKLRVSMMHLTCAVYSHDGGALLGSYNDEDIYLFDTAADVHDKDGAAPGYTHHYAGHRNSATFKAVSFFGPQSQYVVSGSDCANIYIWERESEAIVQWMHGDDGGVVNCIEQHPKVPVLATSGLDKDVKLWAPSGDADPTLEGLAKTVKENGGVSHLQAPLFNDFLPTLFSAWRGESVLADGDEPQYGSNIEFDGNVCTAF